MFTDFRGDLGRSAPAVGVAEGLELSGSGIGHCYACVRTRHLVRFLGF